MSRILVLILNLSFIVKSEGLEHFNFQTSKFFESWFVNVLTYLDIIWNDADERLIQNYSQQYVLKLMDLKVSNRIL